MIEIFEVFGEQATAKAKQLSRQADPLDRVFVMEEAGELCGIAVMGLESGTVVIKDVFTTKPFEYFDLLARSILSVVRDFNPIKVRVNDHNPYYSRFGFDGNFEIKSDKINLAGWCQMEKEKNKK